MPHKADITVVIVTDTKSEESEVTESRRNVESYDELFTIVKKIYTDRHTVGLTRIKASVEIDGTKLEVNLSTTPTEVQTLDVQYTLVKLQINQFPIPEDYKAEVLAELDKEYQNRLAVLEGRLAPDETVGHEGIQSYKPLKLENRDEPIGTISSSDAERFRKLFGGKPLGNS